jgi:hypothetical protein
LSADRRKNSPLVAKEEFDDLLGLPIAPHKLDLDSPSATRSGGVLS